MKTVALIVILTFVLPQSLGCSAKANAKFDKVTDKICKRIREREDLIILGLNAIPEDNVSFWGGLTYRQTQQLCAERNVYYRNNPSVVDQILEAITGSDDDAE